MHIISTWSFRPWLANCTHRWTRTVDMLAAMRAAAQQALRHDAGFSVYTDSASEPWLRRIMPKANLILAHDRAFAQVNFTFWAWPKILTYGLQTQPYQHIDLDFILGPAWQEPARDAAVVIQCWEDLTHARMSKFYNFSVLWPLYRIPAVLDCDFESPRRAANMGCVIMRDMAFNRDYVTAVTELVMNNLDQLNCREALTMSSIEQETLGIMLDARPDLMVSALNTMQEPPVNNAWMHFVGWWKNRSNPPADHLQSQFLSPLITPELEQIAHELDAARYPGPTVGICRDYPPR
jgi:hypothetical protein